MRLLKNSVHLRSLLWLFCSFCALTGLMAAVHHFSQPSRVAFAQDDPIVDQLSAIAEDAGTVRVIVQLDVPFEPVGNLDSPQAVSDQLFQIDRVQDEFVESISGNGVEVTADFKTIPYIGLEVSPEGLDALLESGLVLGVEEDVAEPPLLKSSGDLFGASAAYAHNVTGEGQTVAILDTGVEIDHDAFKDEDGNSRIVAEGCYSSTNGVAQSVCPGGVEETTAAGSGTDCVDAVSGYTDAEDDCTHGTHVAGIAAGYDDDQQVYGVAPGANIIAIQVFSLFTSVGDCVYSDDCVLTYRSDQILGLERVYELRNTYNIASANMSLGGGSYTGACDTDSRKSIIDNLASVGIATVIAAGNSGYVDAVGAPACISTAITVGSTDDDDTVASYSNIGPQIDLVAPGTSIFAAVPSNAYDTKQGTSMASPQIAGAWALIKELDNDATVSSVLTVLETGAASIDDDRTGTPITDMARPNLLEAINSIAPALTLALDESDRFLSAGERLTYTLNINNETDLSASNLLITATVPAEATLDPSSLSGDASYSGIEANSVITWNIPAALNAEAAISRQYAVVVDADYTEGGFIGATANITATEMDRAVFASQMVTVNSPKTCGYTETFESGFLDQSWSIDGDSSAYARVSNRSPNNGSYALLLDNIGQDISVYAQAEAILHINLAGAQDAELSFEWNDLADEYNAAYDGVFIRENGNESWSKIYNFSGDSNNGVYQSATIDLDAEALSEGIALTENFQIKLGFYDNYPANPINLGASDGYAIDDLSVTCTYDTDPLLASFGPDAQSLAPGDAQTYTLVLTNPGDGLHSGVTLTGTIASEFELTGSITLEGGASGAVSTPESTGSPAVILSSAQILSGSSLTLTLPVQAVTNVAAGTNPSISIAYSSDQDPAAATADLSATILNVAPVAVDDSALLEGTDALIIDLLDNDTDANGESLTLLTVADPSSGSVSIESNQLRYDPVLGYEGTEVISYTVRDGAGLTDSATLTLQVNANPIPVVGDDTVNLVQNGAVTIDVLANDDAQDGGNLTIIEVATPSNGSAQAVNNEILYTPAAVFKGSDTFAYTVQNGSGMTANGLVTALVPNVAPTAADDSVTVVQGESVTISPLTNDSDQNDDTLSILAIGTPTNGVATLLDSETIIFTATVSVSAVLTYTVSDGDSGTDVGSISVAVTNSESEEIVTESFPIEQENGAEQTIESDDGKLEIKIPTDSVPPEGKGFTYQTLVTPTQSLPVNGAGTYFVLELVNESDSIIDDPVFDPPLEVKITYDPDRLNGIAIKNLIMMYFDESEGKWISVPVIAHDETNHTLTISLSHFTEFAVTEGYLTFSPFIVE